MLFIYLNDSINCFDLKIETIHYKEKKLFEVKDVDFEEWCKIHQVRVNKINNHGKIRKVLMRGWFECGEVWDSMFDFEIVKLNLK